MSKTLKSTRRVHQVRLMSLYTFYDTINGLFVAVSMYHQNAVRSANFATKAEPKLN